MASAEYFAIISIGAIGPPPRLLLIFPAPSAARPHPEMAISFQGKTPKWWYDFTIVSNAHVRMISCACGRSDIGKTCSYSCLSVSQRPTIWGDMDEVAHVSIT